MFTFNKVSYVARQPILFYSSNDEKCLPLLIHVDQEVNREIIGQEKRRMMKFIEILTMMNILEL
ncbi:hypothetical protein JHK82_053574 [Glycine max]|uniref:Uncharacterized protein n=1 Tax=Glycine max TaxID=3847 RepID=A0A0R0ELS5_SOYBN|nr:hypothetical protein JHK87_053496 [Glycine soja]KAG5086177.1 hypothetical protein JHK82_053574 [Glycine max]KRG95277.1 hypothetical protein GLYMA_19G141000v4 [Glycine max]